MDTAIILEMPGFQPKYKKWKKYGYRNTKEKKNLKNVLEESSKGYCMYCFTRIKVDNKLYAHLEHSIEKVNSEKLTECIPNIGLACSTCNQVFKKCGEKNRKLSIELMKEYENNSKCSLEKRKQCTVPCKALRKLQKQYSALPEGKIILQPMGVKGTERNEELAVQYDVLKMEFQPASNSHIYSTREMDFIETHIKRFHLNDPKYRTHQLYEFVKNVIDSGGKIPKYEYNNWIVEQFLGQLEGKNKEEILKICSSIYCIAFQRM